MLIFAKALLAGRSGPLGAAAERATSALITTPEWGYGVALARDSLGRTWSHDGGTGGYRTSLTLYPDKQQALILLASNNEVSTETVLLRMQGKSSASLTKIEVTADDMSRYAGVYAIKGNPAKFTFVSQQGKLYARLTGQLFNALVPTAKEVFELAEVGAKFIFTRDADNKVSAVTLEQGGNKMQATRSATAAPATIGPAQIELKKFAGRYALNKDAIFDVQAAPGALLVTLTNQPRIPVFATANPLRFEYDLVEAALEFEQQADGSVNALVLHQNGMKQRAARLRE